jgi:hypothetical protein
MENKFISNVIVKLNGHNFTFWLEGWHSSLYKVKGAHTHSFSGVLRNTDKSPLIKGNLEDVISVAKSSKLVFFVSDRDKVRMFNTMQPIDAADKIVYFLSRVSIRAMADLAQLASKGMQNSFLYLQEDEATMELETRWERIAHFLSTMARREQSVSGMEDQCDELEDILVATEVLFTKENLADYAKSDEQKVILRDGLDAAKQLQILLNR